MLSITQLKKGTLIVLDGNPYEIIDYAHSHMGRGGSVVQAKVKNLVSGNVFERTFKPADKFEEAEITKRKVTFLYRHRGSFVFQDPQNPKERWTFDEKLMNEAINYLKPNLEVELVEFEGNIIRIKVPIKVDLKVTQAPPSERGDTRQGGSKKITVETGYQLNAPFFISTGDIIRINTETGEYVERMQKGDG